MELIPIPDRPTEMLILDVDRIKFSIHAFMMGCDRMTANDHEHERKMRRELAEVEEELKRRGKL